MAVVGWSQLQIDPLTLELDALNPRIDVAPDASQDQIRLQLLKHEEVVQLAKQITDFGGLMPGERIILWRNGNRYIVLEGNRRVCAIQLLLDPSLVPSHVPQFPRVASQEVMAALSSVDADVAPSRESAEAVLTKRHTEPSVRSWSTVAKLRRVWRLVDSGASMEAAAGRLGARTQTVRRFVREYRLLDQAKRLPVWTSEERDRLDDERLRVTNYLRFFTLEETRARLGISFNSDERLISDLPRDLLDALLEGIARTMLLQQGSDKAGSRMSVDEVLQACPHYDRLLALERQRAKGDKSRDDASPNSDKEISQDVKGDGRGESEDGDTPSPSQNPQPAPKPEPTPRPPRFFENLTLTVSDPILEQIVVEIRLIQHYRMPFAATFLLRALLEASLRYQIRKAGKWDQLMAGSRNDPGMDVLINFAADRKNNIFKEKRAADVLSAFRQSGHKEVFDLVVHAQWVHANAKTLEQAASLLRQVIVYVLNDERRGELGATAS